LGHRQATHAATHRAGQGQEGPPRDALTTFIGDPERLLVGGEAEHVVVPRASGFCRPQWRTAVVSFPHAIRCAISRPFAESTPLPLRRGAVSPQLLALTPLARTRAAPSAPAKSP